MPFLRIHSPAEQVADHLRERLSRRVWVHEMPGTPHLAAELGVDRKTITAALHLLEHEGILVPRGAGRPRRIEWSGKPTTNHLRIVLLPLDPRDVGEPYLIELRHELIKAGHEIRFSPKSMLELGMEIPRLTRMIRRTSADAWIAAAAPRGLLEWFSQSDIPVMALFGRRRGVAVAGVGPDKAPAMAAATRRLLALGHRRIVLLTRALRRRPVPGTTEQAFLNTLISHGIQPGPYHLPDWEESVPGFHQGLEALFRHTPPTALIIEEAPFLVAAQQFLGNRGLRVPRDVSLICTDHDPSLEWCLPGVAHIRWPYRPVVRRIIRWAAHVSQGKPDRRQELTAAGFIDGGTVGRAPKSPRRPAERPTLRPNLPLP